ncbi:MAG TPA: ImmA/IrrE family metallo-endopeptidase [Spirochaetota bacterium]|nr:ImmA/IrrE family metallo-endopeptidase [Spirochaetota bacterium]
MSSLGQLPVDPMSRNDIECSMQNYLYQVDPGHLQRPGCLDVEAILDLHIYKTHKFKKIISEFIGPNIEALTHPFDNEIEITTQVQDGIAFCEPRHLFTGCHEISHVIMHVPQYLAWGEEQWVSAVARSGFKMQVFRDPEWQAEHGAGVLMMPASTFIPFVDALNKKGASYDTVIYEITRTYGVSLAAAKVRHKIFYSITSAKKNPGFVDQSFFHKLR